MFGSVTVIATRNGPGNFYFSIDERPFVAPVPLPQPPQPQPPPPPPQPPQNTANLKVGLEWNALVDLDLWVTEPNNPNKIFFRNLRGAGKLDHDNTRGEPNSSAQYSVMKGPAGDYRIEVNYYADHRAANQGRGSAIDYWLIINDVRSGPFRLERVGQTSFAIPKTAP